MYVSLLFLNYEYYRTITGNKSLHDRKYIHNDPKLTQGVFEYTTLELRVASSQPSTPEIHR